MNTATLESIPAASVVSLFDTNKEQRSSFVMGILEALDSGRIDPLRVHKQIKCMEQIIAMLTDRQKYPNTAFAYTQHLLDAAGKMDEKKFEFDDAIWQTKEVGVTWDYSQCNDPELPKLEEDLKQAGDALKERQKYLQNIPESGIPYVDMETGETLTIYKAAKKSTTTLSVSLK